jgi:uncharacterized protein (DUF2062 family)|tara:strand:- start:98906 stop:99496 length:591 start_codon:yes stop_codon:yes gene_type:complete
MFQRKNPLTFLQSTREALWPSMGWLRTLRYMMCRILRLSDSPYRIAGGMAMGASISFTPIVGTHILQAFLFSFFIRTNYFAAMIGTVVGNPWTFPFMWYVSYQLGVAIFALFGMPVALDLPEGLTLWQSVDMALHQPLDLFLPWMVGGYMLAALTWPVFFVVFFILVQRIKHMQRRRRLKSLHNAAVEVTGQNARP